MENVLITGASRGIGAACAEKFAQSGYRVLANYNKSEEGVYRLCERTGAIPIKFDVSNSTEVRAASDYIHKLYGPVLTLINNAGIAQQKLFSDITENDWDHMFGVNIKGMFLVTREFTSDMIREKRGKVINVSSVWGITGASCEVHYSASKAAVTGFTKALAKELGPSNINVNCVAPGIIDTDMNAHIEREVKNTLMEETPLCRFGTAEEIADIILFLASAQADFITGSIIKADGGFAV